MDVETYQNYLHQGPAFGADQVAKLESLMVQPAYAGWYPVIQALLKHRKRVEQESIRANDPTTIVYD